MNSPRKAAFLCGLFMMLAVSASQSTSSTQFRLTLQADSAVDRSRIANSGALIEKIHAHDVVALANLEEKQQLEKAENILAMSDAYADARQHFRDFPPEDSDFYNYDETTALLRQIAQNFPNETILQSAGKSVEGRDLWSLVISKDVAHSDSKPAILYMGGHHAREHLSVDIPLRFVSWLMNEYKNGNPRIVHDFETRQIHVIPMVNPDGLEYDIATGSYQMWRKNRRPNSDGTYGIDLNRNYGFQWGTGGSSTRPNSETYMGPSPFSEPETQAMRDYIDHHPNLKTILSFHTYSELILYPWGHTNQPPPEPDHQIFAKLADKMATWNHYKAEQVSDLYIASGDVTDWAYGTHHIFGFTFELDPEDSPWSDNGFYPGEAIIQSVLEKNIEPCLYLLELSDDPSRVLTEGAASAL